MRLVWVVPLAAAAGVPAEYSPAAAAEHRPAGAGAVRFYDLPLQPRPSERPAVSPAANSELRTLRAINEEIVSLLPLGLLVHDQEANRTVISNPIADHLLPHLNLQNITNMADQHQGVIQATINNELYEIRQFAARSRRARRSSLFAIRTAKCWSIKTQTGPAPV
jgi:hypothetical protein